MVSQTTSNIRSPPSRGVKILVTSLITFYENTRNGAYGFRLKQKPDTMVASVFATKFVRGLKHTVATTMSVAIGPMSGVYVKISSLIVDNVITIVTKTTLPALSPFPLKVRKNGMYDNMVM